MIHIEPLSYRKSLDYQLTKKKKTFTVFQNISLMPFLLKCC